MVMREGGAIDERSESGVRPRSIVRDAAQVSRGEHLRIRLASGGLGVIVEDIE
jgi:hypothetical protein